MTLTAEKPTTKVDARPSHRKRNAIAAATAGGVLIAGAGAVGYAAAHNGPAIRTEGSHEIVDASSSDKLAVLGGMCLQRAPDGATFIVMPIPVTLKGTDGVWGVQGPNGNGGLTLVRYKDGVTVCAPEASQSTPASVDGLGAHDPGKVPPLGELNASEYDQSVYPGVPILPGL